MNPELRGIIERLEKVERQNRSLKSGFFTVLVLAGGALMMGQARPSRTVVAQKFVVTDARGETRAVLGMDKSGAEPQFGLYDTNGNARAYLTLAAEGPHLDLSDANGKASVDLVVIGNGPILSLSDVNGKERLSLNVYRDLSGGPDVVLTGPDGTARLSLQRDARRAES